MPRAWATAQRQPPAEKREDPVTVLVTGFGPFLERFPKNTSWEIASTLPALLPATSDNPTPIHIHVHHAPIRVAYNSVRSLIPKLLPPENPITPVPSIILHIGLAAGRDFYTLENGSHGRGYGAIPDVDGERFTDQESEEAFPRSSFPPVLKTSFDTSDVLSRWKANLTDIHPTSDARSSSHIPPKRVPDVRLTPDAGNFLCGFIYYNSLAHYFDIKEDERPVAFLHVPDLSSSEVALDVGREVAIALIKALVESRRVKGCVDSLQGVKLPNQDEVENVSASTDFNFA
ncbi:pyroglutamyl peptidase-like protein type I [Aaosphaeria arxii CBS 175.79]|uniref:Pyroglutamyl peptidase-like protein type I n=1 Tax=Aaosphaeria arxii CBS 175.79 TaxID=1450172 RepID=A0A6A5XF92_9PLEO|nr:pyroglutamyl peptidase-like protein type I [Aaosphaeria arxii CBS 175.79]KAF2011600.1 pyroglutamyl peptidase-like protein type I [Aaosphaeria arxii CBS 175.79]